MSQQTEFSYSLTSECHTPGASNHCCISITPSQPFTPQSSCSQDNFFDYSTVNNFLPATWGHKPCDENIDIPALEPLGEESVAQDQLLPLINNEGHSFPRLDVSPLSLDTNCSRRQSGSSFSLPSAGPAADGTLYEDLSAHSDAPSYLSGYHSRNSSSLATTPLSAVTSPMRPPRVRAGSRSRASPSPRSAVRPSPYPMENARSNRWSTGSYASSLGRRNSFFLGQNNDRPSMQGLPYSSHLSSPIVEDLKRPRPDVPSARLDFTQSQLPSSSSPFTRRPESFQLDNPFYQQSPFNDHYPTFEVPTSLPSHNLFNMLESNADINAHHQVCNGEACNGDTAEAPDLYADLHCDPSSPPFEDMHTTDPELKPFEQELRFDGDLYTPRWVRGHGNKREGWCGICKPGRWLVLKNSAYWYDKSFSHGVSAANGSAFEEPKATRQTESNPDLWEGLCGSCDDWLALVSNRKKRTTWFRHAYKCHTHAKIKDSPKRRRENLHGRSLSTASVTKLNIQGTVPTVGTKSISPLDTLSSMM
ncbi:MAG: hypothetical protein M1835_007351 [Candelina submexicana]|nr:MAG: hypothetical protein M1835_007351 [Candelina submexicana]